MKNIQNQHFHVLLLNTLVDPEEGQIIPSRLPFWKVERIINERSKRKIRILSAKLKKMWYTCSPNWANLIRGFINQSIFPKLKFCQISLIPSVFSHPNRKQQKATKNAQKAQATFCYCAIYIRTNHIWMHSWSWLILKFKFLNWVESKWLDQKILIYMHFANKFAEFDKG